MPRYTSTGTVKVQRSWTIGDPAMEPGESATTRNVSAPVLFVPDASHSIRHDDRSYAVFVRDPYPSRDPAGARVWNIHESGRKWVPLHIAGGHDDAHEVLYNALYQAAMKRCKVKVVVEIEGHVLQLVGITVPAP